MPHHNLHPRPEPRVGCRPQPSRPRPAGMSVVVVDSMLVNLAAICCNLELDNTPAMGATGGAKTVSAHEGRGVTSNIDVRALGCVIPQFEAYYIVLSTSC